MPMQWPPFEAGGVMRIERISIKARSVYFTGVSPATGADTDIGYTHEKVRCLISQGDPLGI